MKRLFSVVVLAMIFALIVATVGAPASTVYAAENTGLSSEQSASPLMTPNAWNALDSGLNGLAIAIDGTDIYVAYKDGGNDNKASVMMFAVPYTGPIFYVKQDGMGDCSTWANACDLQTALVGADSGDEIWVMAGTHKPGALRTDTFQLKNGVEIYGGFAGTESLLSERDPAANLTTLSGDLNGNDNANITHNEATRADNSYHVVTGSGTDSTAVLDGFTVSSGNANEVSCLANGCGGGMFNENGNPTLTNLTFSSNSSYAGGSGMFNTGSSPTLTNVTFSSNTTRATGGFGGGMFNSTNSDPTLTNVTFSGNSSYGGGGMFNSLNSDPMLTNVTFNGNSTSYSSGGGGMYNNNNSNPTLTNVIIANSTSGGDCVNASSTVNAQHSLIEDGLTCVNGTNTNNLTGDPNLGPLADNGGFTQTHALLPGSPAIDAGTNTGYPATDQRGVTRDANYDIGAFEYDYTGVYHVKTTPTGAMNCQSWDDACGLQTALATAKFYDHIWVMAGTHTPHDSDRTVSFILKNGIPIYGGFAGTETLLSERDPAANLTILSGDLNGDDEGFTNNDENSYHVIDGSGTNLSAILDGFIITAGNADGSNNNSRGGGVFISAGNPALMNLTITGNRASDAGGGVFVSDGNSPGPVIYNVTLNNNEATAGGGISNHNSAPKLTNMTIAGNTSTDIGGGIYNENSDAELTHVTISSNSADFGGGMYNFNSNPALKNVILWGNIAQNGLEIYNDGSTPVISYSIVQGSGGSAAWDTGFGTDEGGNLDVNPLLGPLANNGGFTQAHALLPGSPAIDAGDNDACPPTDQRGVERPQGSGCDIGAYESNEQILNGGFNTYPAGKKIPTSWKAVKFSSTDGKKTTVKQEGAASVRITGTGVKKTLSQTLMLSGSTGDAFDFSFWVKGKSIPTSGVCRAQILFYNGATLNPVKPTINCVKGTYGFNQKSLAFTAPGDYTKIIIRFTYTKASGRVWFDAVSLSR